jgi:hypothetical protein
MTEEVAQYIANKVVCGAKFCVDVRTEGWVVREQRYLRNSVAYRQENAVDLGVFVLNRSGKLSWGG